MRVLVIGSGGREHALAWKLAQNSTVEKVYAAPGNGGMARLAECVPLDLADLSSVADFADRNAVDLTVVGPEAPLVDGIVNVFTARGLRVFGPSGAAARIEGSKAFAKQVMARAGVPTAESATFTDYDAASRYVRERGAPIVVKADGLAAGKGVAVAKTVDGALTALEDCLVKGRFGEAGRTVVVEECLFGQEVSLLAFTDGRTVLPMVPAQDYKRAFDGDEGPNTGGMGCYSPVPILDAATQARIVSEVLEPVVKTMGEMGAPYQGVLYGGIILTDDGPKVLEFNARFGDPETQAILPRLTSDLAEVMLATIERNLGAYELHWSDDVCVSVVLASGGYPGPYLTGKQISGTFAAEEVPGVTVFHAGTKLLDDGNLYTVGGRVMNVSGTGSDFAAARDGVYEAISRIEFEGMHYRTDIALRAVEA